jgi:hypothetical protein
MKLVGQDLRQKPDFAAMINVQVQYSFFFCEIRYSTGAAMTSDPRMVLMGLSVQTGMVVLTHAPNQFVAGSTPGLEEGVG